jgi:hypothetical protein
MSVRTVTYFPSRHGGGVVKRQQVKPSFIIVSAVRTDNRN